jgi:conjugal transfer pilus assembly protein TraV
MTSVIKACAIGAVVLTTAGCASQGKSTFSCTGLPGSVTCMDAMTVYEITSDPALEAALRAELARRSAQGEKNIDTRALLQQIRGQASYSAIGRTSLMAPLTQPMPVLEPARVVRIWIAPWVDRKGDLHMPSYVFSEITPRRWSLGEAEVSNTQVLAPVQVQQEATAPPTRASAAKASRTPASTAEVKK